MIEQETLNPNPFEKAIKKAINSKHTSCIHHLSHKIYANFWSYEVDSLSKNKKLPFR